MPTIPIRLWAEDDRPREKLSSKGRNALSDAELLAIIIGSGSRDESAVELAKRILRDSDHKLHDLGKLSLKELMNYKGIGEAKAISIAAALELGRRRKDSDIARKPRIASSYDTYRILGDYLSDLPHEELWLLLLNRASKLEAKMCISSGGVSGTIADIKLIFKHAIEHLASAIVLVHNHPSGNIQPSQRDIKLTEKITDSGYMLDIPLVDHLIVADREYFSFADEGLIKPSEDKA